MQRYNSLQFFESEMSYRSNLFIIITFFCIIDKYAIKFYFQNLESVGTYFVKLNVLATSFALAMPVGFVVSKFFSTISTNRRINKVNFLKKIVY